MFAVTAMASLFIVPHVYAYDGCLLLLPIWLMIFESAQPVTRIAATLFSTPIPFGFALADKPYAVVASMSMLATLLLAASEAIRGGSGRTSKEVSVYLASAASKLTSIFFTSSASAI